MRLYIDTLTRAAAAAVLLGSLARPLAAQTADTTTVLTLGGAARLAARQSAPAESARLRADEAEARARQARSALLPQLAADVGESQRTVNSATFGLSFPPPPGQEPFLDPNGQIIGPINLLDARARLSTNVFNPAAFARFNAARTAASAANVEATAQAEGAATIAASAYLRVLRAEGVLQAREADSTLAAELVTIAQQQLRAGTGVGLDVTRAQAQLAGTRAQLIAARNELDRAQLDLRRVLNLPLDARIVFTDSLSAAVAAPSPADEAAIVQDAIRRRPDVRAAQRQVDAARQAVGAARAERLPSIGAFADDGYIGKKANNLLNTYDWGVQVSVPLFTGGRIAARVAEQQAVASEAEVRLRDLRQQAAVEARGALLDLRAAAEAVEAVRERLRLAEQEVAQARARFRAGVAGNADVATASLGLNVARTALVDALTALQSAQVALARARGTVTELP